MTGREIMIDKKTKEKKYENKNGDSDDKRRESIIIEAKIRSTADNK